MIPGTLICSLLEAFWLFLPRCRPYPPLLGIRMFHYFPHSFEILLSLHARLTCSPKMNTSPGLVNGLVCGMLGAHNLSLIIIPSMLLLHCTASLIHSYFYEVFKSPSLNTAIISIRSLLLDRLFQRDIPSGNPLRGSLVGTTGDPPVRHILFAL